MLTLDPNRYPDPVLSSTQNEIDNALMKFELEKAKNAIYNCYGIWKLDTQKNLFNLIQKIVELNEKKLSSEHESKNYTLRAAYLFAEQIYIVATNRCQPEFMFIAIDALKLVSAAYEKKNDYPAAIHALGRLNGEAKALQDPVIKRWNNS